MALRPRAYWLFALVAWPAAIWGCFEAVVRVATGDLDGLPAVILLTLCAAATIVVSRWRQRSLAGPGARN
jgi:hypothetical protein